MSRSADIGMASHPRYVVWEVTLKCDLACGHCGSRAGKPRERELTFEEALGVVEQLAAAGTYEVVLIGGEAYLWPPWIELCRALTDAGIQVAMTTGGRQLTEARVNEAAAAGLKKVSLSIDGMQAQHDELRGLKGSWQAAMDALRYAGEAGVIPCANTQINRRNIGVLDTLADTLADAGIQSWQVQLTGPMGRASDRPDWLLQPYDMLELMPMLGDIADRLKSRGILVEAANNLGYFGPHEHRLRRAHWKGCNAGKYVLGIESNGDVKGCPSLPSAPYVGGNLRLQTLAEVLETPRLRFARDRDTSELWGFCAGCYYAEECRGGCSWTAHTMLGRRGNMPYCHHRALTLAERGVRERLERVEAAPGTPFDFGRFTVIEEPLPGLGPGADRDGK